MQDYGYGYWWLVVVNIAFFSLFLAFLPYRRKASFRLSKGIFLAFIVALFTEMYGFPLTIYLLTWLFNYKNPLTHEAGHLLYPELGMRSPLHLLSVLMIFGGMVLIAVGWYKIYKAKGELVTNGIYAYVRHPQYLGIFLITSGFLLQWITIPTAIMFPILVAIYYRLAKEEEKELEKIHGDKYREYKLDVSMFVPFCKLNPLKKGGIKSKNRD
jgi:protein-S-isoprenylcysteine O-methyltransferase Ste14